MQNWHRLLHKQKTKTKTKRKKNKTKHPHCLSQVCCFIKYKRYKTKRKQRIFQKNNLQATHMKFNRYSSWLGRIRVINLFYIKCAACDIRIIIKSPKWLQFKFINLAKMIFTCKYTYIYFAMCNQNILVNNAILKKNNNKLCKRDRHQTMSFTTLKFWIH